MTVLLGVFIIAGWPENSAYVLGIFLGVDMIIYGASWLNFSLFLRRRAERATTAARRRFALPAGHPTHEQMGL